MLLKEITTYLQAQGIGTLGTNLFYGLLPTSPASLVTVFEYGGLPNEPSTGDSDGGNSVRIEYPSIQVVARGEIPGNNEDHYDLPRLKIQNVVAALAKIGGITVTLSGVRYLSVIAKQPPFLLRRDDLFRCEFACNFQVEKDFSAT